MDGLMNTTPPVGGKGVRISTRQIAVTTGKQHKHVLRDVRQMLVGLYGQENQAFENLIKDGPNLDHVNVEVMMDSRSEYVAEIILDREHAMTLVTGYDVKLRKRVIDKLAEIEGGSSILPDFSNPAIAARAWADQVEARQIAERTKAQIGSRREATAMAAASAASRKAGKLEIELDRSHLYASVKRMERDYKRDFPWRPLKKFSEESGWSLSSSTGFFGLAIPVFIHE